MVYLHLHGLFRITEITQGIVQRSKFHAAEQNLAFYSLGRGVDAILLAYKANGPQ